jgi:hypothetical protein
MAGSINELSTIKLTEKDRTLMENSKTIVTSSKNDTTQNEKIKVNPNLQSMDKKKLKEDYKKLKEKNYSRSIDTNNPKNKLGTSGGVMSQTNNQIFNANDINTNRIKINKAKK